MPIEYQRGNPLRYQRGNPTDAYRRYQEYYRRVVNTQRTGRRMPDQFGDELGRVLTEIRQLTENQQRAERDLERFHESVQMRLNSPSRFDEPWQEPKSIKVWIGKGDLRIVDVYQFAPETQK